MSSTYDSPLIPLEDSPEEEFAVEYKRDRFNRYGSDDIGFRYDQYQHRNQKTSVTISKRTLCCYSTIASVIICLIGIVVGRYAFSSKTIVTKPIVCVKHSENTPTEDYDVIRSLVFQEMKATNIESHLNNLTLKPHVAGSTSDEDEVMKYVKQHWLQHLDKVEVYPYDVLLSFPNVSDPNYLGLTYPNGTIEQKTNWTEKTLTEFEDHLSGVLPAFNAYGHAGHASGSLFYVNYGRYQDYERLERMGVNVSGGICMARYGSIFRGDKVVEAEKHNCVGLVIYSDPVDYGGAKEHTWNPSKGDKGTYPNSWWLPPSGVQRGVVRDMSGDPLTPNYPSLNLTFRIEEDEAALPKIPVQPISYADAYKYLSILGGKIAHDTWQGGLNITYRIGGSFVGPHANCTALLHVANYLERKTVHTLTGLIRGWQEPDRYVMLGNHRDAWTLGGADPSSGTAVVLEVIRAMGSVIQRGKWRPRRTVVFCSWAAEEYGLIGSTEWQEQMEKQLMLKAVAYINIDIAVQGNATFRASSVPMLYDSLFNATKNVPNPDRTEYGNKHATVYDTWLARNYDYDHPSRPFVRNIGSGSDYTMILQRTGVPSIDMRYTYSPDQNLSSYPVYHSVHDTFEYFKNNVDRNFNFSLAVGRVASDLLLQLGDFQVLPFRPVEYPNKLQDLALLLEKRHNKTLRKRGITLTELFRVIEIFNESAKVLAAKANKINVTSDPIRVRQINDKLMFINRAFLDFTGVLGRPQYRHVIFAPSSHNSYSGAGFPGVSDAIFAAERGGSWNVVEEQLSIVCLQILSAANLMEEW